MASITIQGIPRDLTVVTCAAILAVNDGGHRDITCSLLHRKYSLMTGLALELHTVRPVWEHDGQQSHFRHGAFVPVQNDVSIL
jgi:hypothetical protein